MSIKLLPDGRARVRVYAGYENGKRKLIDRICPNEREAKRLEAKLRQEVANQEYVAPTRMKVGEFLDQWLETAKADLKTRTYKRYEQLVRVHLKPQLAGLRLARLEPRHVDAILADLKGRVSDMTRLHVYRVLHRALEVAVRWRYVGRNVADAVEPPKADEKPMYVLRPEEANRLLEATRGAIDLRPPDERMKSPRGESKKPEEDLGGMRLYALYLTALYTGMRLGELAGLRWVDCDLGEGVAWVRQALEEGGAKPTFSTPKNRKERPVPLAPVVVEALKKLRAEQAVHKALYGPEYQDFDLVFAQENGRPLDTKGLTRRTHKRLLKKAGLPAEVRFHDLRHTFVSRAMAAAKNPKAISDIAGHHDPGFTLRRYAHSLHEDRREVVVKLETYMAEKEKQGPEQ